MNLFGARTDMWMGFVLLLVAAVLVFVAATPRRTDLPMSRRRPDVPAPPGPLSAFVHTPPAAAQVGGGTGATGESDEDTVRASSRVAP